MKLPKLRPVKCRSGLEGGEGGARTHACERELEDILEVELARDGLDERVRDPRLHRLSDNSTPPGKLATHRDHGTLSSVPRDRPSTLAPRCVPLTKSADKTSTERERQRERAAQVGAGVRYFSGTTSFLWNGSTAGPVKKKARGETSGLLFYPGPAVEPFPVVFFFSPTSHVQHATMASEAQYGVCSPASIHEHSPFPARVWVVSEF